MPAFDERTTAAAPPEEVWKLLYDPARFPDWWVGVATVEPGSGSDDDHDDDGGAYTMYPDGYPDFPMPQELRTSRARGRVEISCLVSDLEFSWQLTPRDGGAATEIAVHVEIPSAEAHRLETQTDVIRRSLANLARLAAES
jgi:uncharacterized protein YndB with AHSA1/START domain